MPKSNVKSGQNAPSVCQWIALFWSIFVLPESVNSLCSRYDFSGFARGSFFSARYLCSNGVKISSGNREGLPPPYTQQAIPTPSSADLHTGGDFN